jgi:hypothetical protein
MQFWFAVFSVHGGFGGGHNPDLGVWEFLNCVGLVSATPFTLSISINSFSFHKNLRKQVLFKLPFCGWEVQRG